MGRANVDPVAQYMTWPAATSGASPLYLTCLRRNWTPLGIKPSDPLLLAYQDQPPAVLEIYSYDKGFLAQRTCRRRSTTGSTTG